MFKSAAVALLATACAVSAKNIYIQVHNNASATNGSSVFVPNEVTAVLGDIVFFNFTEGNHTAIQSTFDAPCLAANVHNSSLNGFNSGFEVVPNNSFLQSSVPILPENVNQTFWFFDANTCGIGGVGVINANESSTETLAGFVRNAVRLNGTATATSTSSRAASTSASGTGSSASSTSTPSSSGAGQITLSSVVFAAPLLLAGLVL
ncbi:hypothetical protein PENSPDRAFT_640038 [Peniophora sp. CONT]|nr:hypothetical protein PENSPDRAFT_640038 [Peniophora sp. CONT]